MTYKGDSDPARAAIIAPSPIASLISNPKLPDNAIFQSNQALKTLIGYGKDGTPFRNAELVAPSFDDAGALEYFIGSQVALADNATPPTSLRRMRAA